MSKFVSGREPFPADWRRGIYGYDGAIVVAENARFAAFQLLIDNCRTAILSNSLKVDFARFGDPKFFEQARRRFVDHSRHSSLQKRGQQSKLRQLRFVIAVNQVMGNAGVVGLYGKQFFEDRSGLLSRL